MSSFAVKHGESYEIVRNFPKTSKTLYGDSINLCTQLPPHQILLPELSVVNMRSTSLNGNPEEPPKVKSTLEHLLLLVGSGGAFSGEQASLSIGLLF